MCAQVLGGIISDQKICKVSPSWPILKTLSKRCCHFLGESHLIMSPILQTCPHRYSKQDPCSVISVDVKNHSNLQDSLAEYTKVRGGQYGGVQGV